MYEELAQRKGWRFDPTDDDYPAERNASIEGPDGLEELMELTRQVVRLLGVSSPVAVS
jgi:hypothetical protein